MIAINSPTSPPQIAARLLEEKALGLRRDGNSYRKIARLLNCSSSCAFKAVGRALQRLLAETAESAEQLRRLELDRLDKMFRGCFEKACRGDLLATDRVLKIMDRRAKYLGLDVAPMANDERLPTSADALKQMVQDRIEAWKK